MQNAAVVRFADWLTNLTVEREVANGGGAGKAKIILCGHRYVAINIVYVDLLKRLESVWEAFSPPTH